MLPHRHLSQPHPRLIVAVGDSLNPGALCGELCGRVVVTDELRLRAQFVNVVDVLRCGRGRLLQDFYRGLSKCCCLVGLAVSAHQWDAPQPLVGAIIPLQHRSTRDPDFCVCCIVYFESNAVKNLDVTLLYQRIETVQVVFLFH